MMALDSLFAAAFFNLIEALLKLFSQRTMMCRIVFEAFRFGIYLAGKDTHHSFPLSSPRRRGSIATRGSEEKKSLIPAQTRLGMDSRLRGNDNERELRRGRLVFHLLNLQRFDVARAGDYFTEHAFDIVAQHRLLRKIAAPVGDDG